MMSESLLPHNATEQERALELASAKLADLPVDVGKLWSPDDCPEALLPWLAWAMSIDDWDSNWSESIKRRQIKTAVYTHRQKGTVGAVKKALASLGVTVDFLEWFDDVHDIALAPVHSTQPYTFVFIAWANENPYTSHEVFLSPQLYTAIERAVNSLKPVRSHFDFLVGAKMGDELKFGASSTPGQVSRKSGRTEPVAVPASENELQLALTTSAHNQVINRHVGRSEPVQVPQHTSDVGAAIATSGQNVTVNRHSATTVATQAPQQATDIKAALCSSQKTCVVSRFYMHG